MNTVFHSVSLDKQKCLGCMNCIKRCPTQAIRVRHGKATIISERCIDCGECIRICPHHAKTAKSDPIEDIEKFKYKSLRGSPGSFPNFLQNRGEIHVLCPIYIIEHMFAL